MKCLFCDNKIYNTNYFCRKHFNKNKELKNQLVFLKYMDLYYDFGINRNMLRNNIYLDFNYFP
jgi:hypothetical protein